MTREEAIQILDETIVLAKERMYRWGACVRKNGKTLYGYEVFKSDLERLEAFEMAKEALAKGSEDQNGRTDEKIGRWVPYESDEEYGYDHEEKTWYKCSECGKDALGRVPNDEWYSYPYITDYCPHCGAKMEKEGGT